MCPCHEHRIEPDRPKCTKKECVSYETCPRRDNDGGKLHPDGSKFYWKFLFNKEQEEKKRKMEEKKRAKEEEKKEAKKKENKLSVREQLNLQKLAHFKASATSIAEKVGKMHEVHPEVRPDPAAPLVLKEGLALFEEMAPEEGEMIRSPPPRTPSGRQSSSVSASPATETPSKAALAEPVLRSPPIPAAAAVRASLSHSSMHTSPTPQRLSSSALAHGSPSEKKETPQEKDEYNSDDTEAFIVEQQKALEHYKTAKKTATTAEPAAKRSPATAEKVVYLLSDEDDAKPRFQSRGRQEEEGLCPCPMCGRSFAKAMIEEHGAQCVLTAPLLQPATSDIIAYEAALSSGAKPASGTVRSPATKIVGTPRSEAALTLDGTKFAKVEKENDIPSNLALAALPQERERGANN